VFERTKTVHAFDGAATVIAIEFDIDGNILNNPSDISEAFS
jgi:hypothetical protein